MPKPALSDKAQHAGASRPAIAFVPARFRLLGIFEDVELYRAAGSLVFFWLEIAEKFCAINDADITAERRAACRRTRIENPSGGNR